jgi:hypothetical protein
MPEPLFFNSPSTNALLYDLGVFFSDFRIFTVASSTDTTIDFSHSEPHAPDSWPFVVFSPLNVFNDSGAANLRPILIGKSLLDFPIFLRQVNGDIHFLGFPLIAHVVTDSTLAKTVRGMSSIAYATVNDLSCLIRIEVRPFSTATVFWQFMVNNRDSPVYDLSIMKFLNHSYSSVGPPLPLVMAAI